MQRTKQTTEQNTILKRLHTALSLSLLFLKHKINELTIKNKAYTAV